MKKRIGALLVLMTVAGSVIPASAHAWWGGGWGRPWGGWYNPYYGGYYGGWYNPWYGRGWWR